MSTFTDTPSISPRPRPLDAAATLQLPLSGSKLIEASAGTGKTYTIANLYLRYVLAGRRVSEILVVTFTNAATEELRGRLRQRLQQMLGCLEAAVTPDESQDAFLALQHQQLQTLPDEERSLATARLRLAVRTMDEAAIHTIHGFCQRALRDHAFSSGQSFDLELVSDDDSLWRDALKDWWRRNTYEADEGALRLLTRAFPSLTRLIDSQRIMRSNSSLKVLPEQREDLSSIVARWRQLSESVTALAAQWQERNEELREILLTSNKLSRAKENYRHLELEPQLEEIDEWFRGSQELPPPSCFELLGATKISDSQLQKKPPDPRLEDPFFTACQTLLDEITVLQHAITITCLHEATQFARQHIENVKQEAQLLTFDDQLSRLLQALQGEHGDTLAQALRTAMPVAMIDEFQDTDAIQYGIFRHIYLQHADASDSSAGPSGMVMIGDPKQAIYSFRGGDIFAYAAARRDAGEELYTLDTNWRSVPALISAVNNLFMQRPAPFLYSSAIDFQPVNPAPKGHAEFNEQGEVPPPLVLWQIGCGEDGKPFNKEVTTELLSAGVADEITRLIRGGADGSIRLGGKPLQPGDIAVLVRGHHEGACVRGALFERGIAAVAAGRDKVFHSDEAKALALLLNAVAKANERTAQRLALATDLLGLRYNEMAAILDDEREWLRWHAQLKEMREQWVRRGFMAMFQTLLEQLRIAMRMAAAPLAERRLTNLLHLAELLQQNARVHPGVDALLNWFREQIAAGGDAENELRLENDEKLVKILTIHVSKGLEYPVVFVPFVHSCTKRESKGGFTFHDAAGSACLDLGSAQQEAHLRLADKERLAEDVRLLYVAVTRARARLYLAWGEVGAPQYTSSASTALAWLLHSQLDADALDRQGFKVEFKEQNAFAPALARLQEAARGTLQVVPLPGQAATRIRLPAQHQAAESLAAVAFNGHIATDWRVNSFTSLTRGIHQSPHGGSKSGIPDPIMDFPAGSRTGLFLHAVFEDLDFTGDVVGQVQVLNRKHAGRFGFDAAKQQETVVNWIQAVLQTPLVESVEDDSLRLGMIPTQQRLNELAFDFAVGKVNVAALDRATRSALSGTGNGTADPAAITLPGSLDLPGGADFRGMITGIIDLVFEHEGRFYIADYKSNYLGSSLEDYAPARLRRAMLERRYDLQAVLYVLALHRYLRQRISDYDYQRHMGGVYYLFLRGMRPQHGARYGVFHDCPALDLVERLDQVILGAASDPLTESQP